MKQTSFRLLTLLGLTGVLILGSPAAVRAGEINAQEARLVSAASGIFRYNGKTYRASAQYVEELRSYLCGEDVDLTAEDVDALISDMYANVELGVQEEYLVETGDVAGVERADGGDRTGEDGHGTGSPDQTDGGKTSDDEILKYPALKGIFEQESYTVEETPEETRIVDSDGSVIFSAAPMIKTVGYHTHNARAIGVIAVLMLTAVSGGTALVVRHEEA